MRHSSRTCIAVLAALVGTELTWSEEPPAKAVVVPFELLKSKHIAIKVKVNGQGPYRLVFDTGAPVTIINNKVALASGVIDKKTPAPFLSVFGSKGPVKIKLLELGEVTAENTAATVMDHPTVEMMAKILGPIDGLLGFPFFARYKMTIDYQAKEMTLTPNGFKPVDTMEAMTKLMTAMVSDKQPAPKVLAPAGQWGFALRKDKNDEAAGVTIESVWADSAAAAAGLEAGDRLLTLDGRWTDTLPDAYEAASYVKPAQRSRC